MKTVALVSALAALSLASASGVDEVTIVFPARAFPAEKTAAEVLADYLGRATGRRYRTVAEGSADVSRGIYVGFTEFAGRNGFRAEDYADEAWRYREVGGNLEDEGAIAARDAGLSLVTYIAGVSAPPEKRMGHAGAIIAGGEGDARSKIRRLEALDVTVATKPSDIPLLIQEIL